MSSSWPDNTAALLPAADMAALLDRRRPLRRLLIAYSGGLDSVVVLHRLAALRRTLGFSLQALYIDHGLRPEAGRWRTHCASVCRQLAVPFASSAVTVDETIVRDHGVEAAARSARYRALAASLDHDSAVVTGHHQDDQAETLLLALLRGAGPTGLAAMPASARLGPGWLLRPLLRYQRSDLLVYARSHRLLWVDDPSNAELRFDRNYLRREILPRLTSRWPAAGRCIARSAALCAESDELLTDIADDDILINKKINGGDHFRVDPDADDTLALTPLRRLSTARRNNLLRRWLAQRQPQTPPPSRAWLQRLVDELILAGDDRQPLLRHGDHELRRYRDRLYALAPTAAHDPRRVIRWPNPDRPLDITPLGTLSLRHTASAPALRAGALQDLEIRFRRGGESLRPAGIGHHRTVKRLLAEAGVPPWQRDRLPLLFAAGRLLAVGDRWLAADALDSAGEGYRLRWQKPGQSVNV